ncbi:MAG: hypothetical protein JRI34_04900 [Deltaproteobacteria bacterium]|nr:hypothetical protein [Deltaproteobacteria bacterium]
MPDWTASFHLPTFTDAEFSAMRDKYVAKYGYTINLPQLEDIIIVDWWNPMSAEEVKNWKQRKYNLFSDQRYNEIKEHKQKKKERFLNLLGSPTPDILHNVGSIMTSLDDCQDALATLAFIGRVTIKLVPSVIGKTLIGPTGWMLLAADVLNLATIGSKFMGRNMTAKRASGILQTSNPLGMTAKAARARKLLQYMPDSADIIQLAQVTGQMFGFGICLGPIIGLAQDLIAGAVRYAMGQEVHFNFPVEDLPYWLSSVFYTLKAFGYVLTTPWETDEPMLTDVMLAGFFANQMIAPYLKQWHPHDNVENIQDIHFLAPIPKDPLTIEVIEEEGLDVLSTCSWRHNNKMWTKIGDYWESSKDIATQNLYHMIDLNKDNRRGQLIGYLGNQIAMQSLSNLVGEENVRYDFTAATKAAETMMYAGYQLQDNIPPDKLQLLVDWLDEMDSIEDSPNFKELSLFCRNNRIPLVPYGS